MHTTFTKSIGASAEHCTARFHHDEWYINTRLPEGPGDTCIRRLVPISDEAADRRGIDGVLRFPTQAGLIEFMQQYGWRPAGGAP